MAAGHNHLVVFSLYTSEPKQKESFIRMEGRVLTAAEIDGFSQEGYLTLPGFASPEEVRQLKELTLRDLSPLMGPAEYEVDVGYPGAPSNREDEGGRTPRRLLHALSRGEVVRRWATQPALGQILSQLMGGSTPLLSQNHHNCIMTKYPDYGTATFWHQDIRYWSFARPELISIWLALGEEGEVNGGLKLLPGSHRLTYTPAQLDDSLFLRTDVPENQPLLASAKQLSLSSGDVLLFHCRTFHAASTNRTESPKLSLVLTAHATDNKPLPGTKSSRFPSLPFVSWK